MSYYIKNDAGIKRASLIDRIKVRLGISKNCILEHHPSLSRREKVNLTILIREIQEELKIPPGEAVEEIKILLQSWIEANDLHPEKVETWRTATFNTGEPCWFGYFEKRG